MRDVEVLVGVMKKRQIMSSLKLMQNEVFVIGKDEVNEFEMFRKTLTKKDSIKKGKSKEKKRTKSPKIRP